MTAYLMVRAEVADPALRPRFDEWYEQEHLRDAREGLGAVRAWRGWSRVEPAVHYAFYEFPDAGRANEALGCAAMKALKAEFDRAWGTRIVRTREMQAAIAKIVAEHGRDGFLDAWLRHRGAGWAADLIPDLTNLETRP